MLVKWYMEIQRQLLHEPGIDIKWACWALADQKRLKEVPFS